MLGTRRHAPRLAALAVLGAALGCHANVGPVDGHRVCRSDEVCVTARLKWAPEEVVVEADTSGPSSLRLRNAALRVAGGSGQPCQAGVPVAAVSVEGEVVPEGPAPLGGAHRIRLRFPVDPAADTYPPPELFLDLHIDVDGQERCESFALGSSGRT